MKISTYFETLNTHTHTQPFYCSVDFVRDNPGEIRRYILPSSGFSVAK